MTEQEWDLVVAVHLRYVLLLYIIASTYPFCVCQWNLQGKYSWRVTPESDVNRCLQVANAVWPLFQKQKYGRIVTTCSQVGICA